MKKTTLLFIAAAFALSGCATQPSDLGTTYVPVATYANYDCDQLTAEVNHINLRLDELYTSLKDKADTDAAQMGIGLLLFWPVLFALEGGDGPEATEYSRIKGEYEAIRQASLQKQCDLDAVPQLKTPEEFKKESENSDS